ncbi:MAG: M20/M25/M40 family metallo-hydrolase, partial [Treponema sp.]|nr:M20/M25/M40 family metallo-hydrolase [Treponema sp.]
MSGAGAGEAGEPGGIDKARLKKRLVELCRIAAPSRREGPVRDYLYAFWQERKDRGLRWREAPASSIPEGGSASNILMSLEGNGEPLLLCAHMDTVPVEAPYITVLEKDGVLRSDGGTILGGDDRSGIALALEMLDLSLAGGGQSLEALFTVQEELGCLGSRNHGFPELRSTLAYCLDGENPPGTIIARAPGKEQYCCEVRGRSAHAALEPEAGRNAIRHGAALLLDFPQGQVDRDTTANLGIIRGGRQTNVVPDYCRITGEIRSFSEDSLAGIKDRINAACRGMNKTGEGYRVDITWEKTYSGYAVSPEEEIVRRFLRGCEKRGVRAEILSSPGGGDGNNLNSQGIRSVVFGSGMHNIHSPEEYLVLEEFFAAAELL